MKIFKFIPIIITTFLLYSCNNVVDDYRKETNECHERYINGDLEEAIRAMISLKDVLDQNKYKEDRRTAGSVADQTLFVNIRLSILFEKQGNKNRSDFFMNKAIKVRKTCGINDNSPDAIELIKKQVLAIDQRLGCKWISQEK